MRRPVVFIVGVALAVGLLPAGVAPAAGAAPAGSVPVFDPASFGKSTRIDNPYFPLRPGTTLVYDGFEKRQAEHNEVAVTHETKVILGVTCVVVRDTVWVDGALAEETLDWYAQDKAGNVWYFGEDSKEYEGGEVVSTAGSWEAGVDGAEPGLAMLADPAVGDAYRQEDYPGVAEDMARVLSLTASVAVPAGAWEGTVLQTREWTPLERGAAEHKYYAPGVGQVKSEMVKGGQGQMELVAIE